jgi:hypothetical protein
MGKTLSDLIVNKTNPKADRFEVPDSVVPGLRLIVQPSGVNPPWIAARLCFTTALLLIGEPFRDDRMQLNWSFFYLRCCVRSRTFPCTACFGGRMNSPSPRGSNTHHPRLNID